MRTRTHIVIITQILCGILTVYFAFTLCNGS